MKILFLCTAHNSLSQRLFLALSPSHDVTVEYALSDELMISAAALSHPDIIICPFLTARVPREIYNNYLTLIIHPGPPGDAGPSALDWVLMGDDGTVEDASKLLKSLDEEVCRHGRSHWGITILQAIEEFDAGPVWAWEQFSINIDQPGLTKSELYRGPVSRAAISACLIAINRIQKAAHRDSPPSPRFAVTTLDEVRSLSRLSSGRVSPCLRAHPDYKNLSVESSAPFKGGRLLHRPLLKAAQRDFHVMRHTARQISRRIRCGDSQPGVLSKIFGIRLYVYGGIIDDLPYGLNPGAVPGVTPGTMVATRNEAVCIATCDGRGVWITHIRRPKRVEDSALWPKVPAVAGLLELGIVKDPQIRQLRWDLPNDLARSSCSTFQEVWIEFVDHGENKRAAYLYFDFYNGAMATSQCSQLIEAMDYVLSCSTNRSPVKAVVLMGGSYFSNGIALNVIEASKDPSSESWRNINRIDDVVHYLLHEFPSRGILTIAGVRGNAAAGGVALATACDLVIGGSEVVLNPAYRGIGLYGSEYHSLSYPGRCGKEKATEILRSMTPLSPFEARSIGLVDHVFPGPGAILDKRIHNHVAVVIKSGKPGRVLWKAKQVLSPAVLASTRAAELSEMAKDFYSARSIRYHSRRFNFVRKVKTNQTPVRFARHRRFNSNVHDEEERDSFDDVRHFERIAEGQLLAQLQKELKLSASSSLKRVDTPRLELPKSGKNGETVFTCYYQPVGGISSPPLSSTSRKSSLDFSVPANGVAAVI